MAHIDIIAAQRTHAPLMSAIIAHSWKQSYYGIVNDQYLFSLPDTHWVDYLERGFDDGVIDAFLAQVDGRPAGCLVCRRSRLDSYPDDCEIVVLYLLSDFIGCGVGKRLLAAAVELMREQGYTHCILDVLEDNRRAQRFYFGQGFEDTGRRLHVRLGHQTLNCFVLRRALTDVAARAEK